MALNLRWISWGCLLPLFCMKVKRSSKNSFLLGSLSSSYSWKRNTRIRTLMGPPLLTLNVSGLNRFDSQRTPLAIILYSLYVGCSVPQTQTQSTCARQQLPDGEPLRLCRARVQLFTEAVTLNNFLSLVKPWEQRCLENLSTVNLFTTSTSWISIRRNVVMQMDFFVWFNDRWTQTPNAYLSKVSGGLSSSSAPVSVLRPGCTPVLWQGENTGRISKRI